jgi:DNA-binding transcriptional MerR regulator
MHQNAGFHSIHGSLELGFSVKSIRKVLKENNKFHIVQGQKFNQMHLEKQLRILACSSLV